MFALLTDARCVVVSSELIDLAHKRVNKRFTQDFHLMCLHLQFHSLFFAWLQRCNCPEHITARTNTIRLRPHSTRLGT
uniref:Uncharacterized protein n=1 Tax=Hyaloperonospora arabidopsidis (strain Emoy2) TaxID=559515 RepID=M4B530_HYAAE